MTRAHFQDEVRYSKDLVAAADAANLRVARAVHGVKREAVGVRPVSAAVAIAVLAAVLMAPLAPAGPITSGRALPGAPPEVSLGHPTDALLADA